MRRLSAIAVPITCDVRLSARSQNTTDMSSSTDLCNIGGDNGRLSKEPENIVQPSWTVRLAVLGKVHPSDRAKFNA